MALRAARMEVEPRGGEAEEAEDMESLLTQLAVMFLSDARCVC